MIRDLNARYDASPFAGNEKIRSLFEFSTGPPLIDSILEIAARKRDEKLIMDAAGFQFSPISAHVLMLRAPTGSGKTLVVLPRFFMRMLENGYARQTPSGSIICAIPQISAVLGAANTINVNYGAIKLGEQLAIATGSHQVRATQDVSLTLCTTQILVNKMMSAEPPNSFSARFSYVFVDECHENSAENEQLIFEIRKYLRAYGTEKNCPTFVFMSATFDHERFANYLGIGLITPLNYINLAATNRIPIAEHYAVGGADRVDKMVGRCVMDIIRDEGPTGEKLVGLDPRWRFANDIMVFVPGQREAEAAKMAIEWALEKKKYAGIDGPYIVTGQLITAGAAVARMLMTNKPVTLFNRRIYVVTNALEKSVTVTSLSHVIDTGWQKTMIYFPLADFSQLLVVPAGNFSITQRMGRIGRNHPGSYWGMYEAEYRKHIPLITATQSLFDVSFSWRILRYLAAEIKNKTLRGWSSSNFVDILMMLRSAAYAAEHDYVVEMDFIGGISVDLISAAMWELFRNGLVNSRGNITPLGVMMHETHAQDLNAAIFVCELESRGINKFDIAMCLELFRHVINPRGAPRGAKREGPVLLAAIGKIADAMLDKQKFERNAIAVLRKWDPMLAPLVLMHEFLNRPPEVFDGFGLDRRYFAKMVSTAVVSMKRGGKMTASVFDELAIMSPAILAALKSLTAHQ